ncbi:MAG: chemotaxis response regulator protein-glutamate methylesterase [Vicinamibacteria bacterium]|nr:chemotaxis response regulator protein-glutamate methylesterase [Vicinamibacteria bacterium]
MESSGIHRRARKGVPGARIHVLVVDDSAVVRQSMTLVLGREKDLRVTTAADPLIAMEKMRRDRPHVVLLDLEMPRMDGLTFLRSLMKTDPLPVVVCSGVAERGSARALEAIEEGAVDVLSKPRFSVREFIEEQAVLFADAVRGAASARLGRPPLAVAAGEERASAIPRLSARTANRVDPVIAVGVSIGGPAALAAIVPALPSDLPGIVAVQHMPEAFTAALASRLDRLGVIRVKLAQQGDPVIRGQMLLSPGDRHLRLRKSGPGFVVDLDAGPLISRHRPSVDALFHSVAAEAGGHALGVILTGMGTDGAAGLLEMRRGGAMTLAQDEATSVVYGMPGEAVARGAVDEIVPLDLIPAAIVNRVEALILRQEQAAAGASTS